MNDIRSVDRLHKHYPVLIHDGVKVESTISYDLSEQGLSVFSHRPFSPGTKVDITVLPDDAVLLKLNYNGQVQWCTPNDREEFEDYEYVAGIKFLQAWGHPIEQTNARTDYYQLSRSILVNAPMQLCYQVICDFEKYPEWHAGVVKVLVRERSDDGKPLVVQWCANMILKQVSYTNGYTFDDTKPALSWKLMHGDISRNEGCYRFEEKSPNSTLITFEFTVELGFKAPQRIVDFVATITFRKVMNDMKQRIEAVAKKQSGVLYAG